MKVKHLFFSLIVAAFLSSAMWVDNSLKVGNKAPKIETTEGINVGYDANSEGKTKIINFWTPKNADSRIANKKLSHQFGVNPSEDIEFISICTDSDEALMNDVMRIDGVNADNNYAYSSINPRAFKDYGVEKHPRTFMIAPDGKIEKIM